MSSAGWRWVYYFNAIFFALCALAILALYNPPPTRLRREHSTREIIKSIDFIGIFLLLSGVVTIVISLTWGGHTYGWSSGPVLAPLITGATLLIAFGLYGKMMAYTAASPTNTHLQRRMESTMVSLTTGFWSPEIMS